MDDNKKFIYVDKFKNVIKMYSSRITPKYANELYNKYKKCTTRNQSFSSNILSFYNKPSGGIAHGLSKLTSYLRFADKYKAITVIPNDINANIISLIKPVFGNKIRILESNKIYIFHKFIFSAYFELMDNPTCMKPDNKYPLIVYNNDIYWFRAQINSYVDALPIKPTFEKIFVGKFEGQGKNSIVAPRSLLGCIPKILLAQFELNKFEIIDPYKYNIIDVIYYIRNAKKLILSCGTAACLYLPYVRQTTKLYFMTNVISEAGILLKNQNCDDSHNKYFDLVQRFFSTNYKIVFYKYAPYYDYGVKENNVYTGENNLDFLRMQLSTTTRYIIPAGNVIKTDNSIQFSIQTHHTFDELQLGLIKPYGTSRMRYELVPVLDIVISQSIKESNLVLNCYDVHISKNQHSKSSRNASLFWGNDFKIPIEIWTPIQSPLVRELMRETKITNQTVTELLPEKYGSISVLNGEGILQLNNTSPIIGIVVPFYSRPNYVSQFLESLNKTDLKNCIVVFVDESLTKDVTDDHQNVHKMVKTFKFSLQNETTPLIKIYKHKHGNMNESILYGLDFLYNYCDILSTVDSDTIHNENWITNLMNSYNQCKTDFDDGVVDTIILSGFNVESDRHQIINTNPNYITKTSVGGCHMMFSKDTYIRKIRHCLHSHKWDSNIIENVKQSSSDSYKIITTNPSCVQHIGIKTTNATRTHNQNYDYALDFM
jgi:hypothetical protein